MTERTGINTALLNGIFVAPPAWTNDLCDTPPKKGFFLPELLPQFGAFLNSTMDAARLVNGSNAASAALSHNSLDELQELRSNLQLLELSREIGYGYQTDHTAHTLYLYLLGLYFYLHCPEIRRLINKQNLLEKDQSAAFQIFALQWAFCSILHDVGYVFHGSSPSERRCIDRVFRASWITRQAPSLTDDQRSRVRAEIAGLRGTRSAGSFEGTNSPEDLLDALRNVPWGKEAGLGSCDLFEIFERASGIGQVTPSDLEDYAYQVAATGYDGHSDGVVDHAVSSGLFLLRYSTYWSWLAKSLNFKGPFREFASGNYPEEAIVTACFAVAAHNMIGVHADINSLSADSNALLYLQVMCDELQKWDRFPSGARYLSNLEEFAKACTDSERMTLGVDDAGIICISIDPAELRAKITKAIDRLTEPSKYVRLVS